MIVTSTRFGAVELHPDDAIRFAEGIRGLEQCRTWAILEDPVNGALAWLQSLQRPDLALPVVSPRRFVPGYRLRVAERELAPLELAEVGSAEVLAIVGRSGPEITLNLAAPLVLNLARRVGRQVIANGAPPLQYVLDNPELSRNPIPPLRKSA